MTHEELLAAPAAPSRRTVLKGAAWAVPVVAVATTVPFAAATTCNGLSIDPQTVGPLYDEGEDPVNVTGPFPLQFEILQNGSPVVGAASLTITATTAGVEVSEDWDIWSSSATVLAEDGFAFVPALASGPGEYSFLVTAHVGECETSIPYTVVFGEPPFVPLVPLTLSWSADLDEGDSTFPLVFKCYNKADASLMAPGTLVSFDIPDVVPDFGQDVVDSTGIAAWGQDSPTGGFNPPGPGTYELTVASAGEVQTFTVVVTA